MHMLCRAAAVANRFGLPFHTLPFSPCSTIVAFRSSRADNRHFVSVSTVAHLILDGVKQSALLPHTWQVHLQGLRRQ
jgi:hypothetical protein